MASPTFAQGWVKIGQPCTSTQAFVRDFTFGVDDADLWVVCRTDGVQHSTDGGVTWTAVNGGLGGITGNVGGITSTPLGLYIWLTGTVNSNQGAYRLVGSTWTKISSLPPTPVYSVGRPIIDLVYHAATHEVIALANDGSVSAFASTDGVTFTKVKDHVHNGLGLAFFQDGQGRFWAGTEADGNWRSTDAGRTWTKVGTYVNGLAYGDGMAGNVLYAERANVYRFDDVAWTHTTGIYYLDTVRMFATDGVRAYAVTFNVQTPLYASTDGQAWTPYLKDGSQPPTTIGGFSVQVDSQGRLLVGMGDGWLYRVGTGGPPPPPPFACSTEGTVTFTNGAISGYSGFACNDPSQAKLDTYVHQHYQHVP